MSVTGTFHMFKYADPQMPIMGLNMKYRCGECNRLVRDTKELNFIAKDQPFSSICPKCKAENSIDLSQLTDEELQVK